MNKNKDKRSYKNCCSAGCINNTYNSDLTFFSLPNEVERRSIWLKLLMRQDLEQTNSVHFRVCESHFDPESILVTPTRKLLKRQAVPRLWLPVPRPVQAAPSRLSPADNCTNSKPPPGTPLPQTSTEPINSRKRKLIILKSDMSECRKKEIFFELCDRFLTKNLSQIVKEQTNIIFNDYRKKYSVGYKIFCLNLYHASPEAYNLLSDTLCLPCRPTLLRMLEPVFTQPNHIMEALKIKAARLTDRQKQCCVFIDAIKLKKNSFYYCPKEDRIFGFHHEDQVPLGPAKYALVAVVQGIFDDYRQPAGYTMLADDADSARVALWTDHLIRQLCAAGLNVRALIPGSSYPFLNSAKTRIVSAHSPYFFVNKRKIFYMFDPSQIIVEIRDTLMMYDFHFYSSVAKWDDIRQFYKKDSANQPRLAPRLTDRHMYPSSSEEGEARARLAAQVFGAPVAAGITAYASLGGLDASAAGTVGLILKINDLVEFFNLSSKYDCSYHRDDVSDPVHKVYFINRMLNFLSTLKLIDEKNGIDVTSLATFIESSQITLISILNLYESFVLNGSTYELTRRLNRDFMEEFLDSVKKNYKNTKPTSSLVVTEFRKSYLSVLFRPRKQGYDVNSDVSALFDDSIAAPQNNHTTAGVSKASSSKIKKRAGALPRTAIHEKQHVSNDNVTSHTVTQEPKMEVDDEMVLQIKKEQEDFMNMDIKIEEHEITVPSRQPEHHDELSLVRKEDDSPIKDSSVKEVKDENIIINTTLQIKQEKEDLLSASFEMEEEELIILSSEEDHNYDVTFINQDPDNITRECTSLVQDDMPRDVAKGTTSKDESTISSPHSNKSNQHVPADDSESEVDFTDDCFLRRSMIESDEILTMVFTIENKKEPYKKCKEPIRITDNSMLKLPKKNSLVYISGWLLQRCQFWHKDCADFNAYAEVYLAKTPCETQFRLYKECNSNNDVPDLRVCFKRIPQDGFIKYVEIMDGVFCEFFKSPQIHSRDVLGTLLEAVKKVGFEMPCLCFPIDYLRQLFFRIRLHHTLACNNISQRSHCKTFSVQKLC